MAGSGQRKDRETGEWTWRRENGATSDWPVSWPTRAGPGWLEPPTRWTPDRAGSAVIICVRGSSRCGNPSQILDWGTPEQAVMADRLLYGEPCGEGCEGQHVRVWTEVGSLHVASSVHDEPPPSSRAQAFTECYRRLVNGRPVTAVAPVFWPKPSVMNQPLPPRGTMMIPETKRAQAAAVEAAAGREFLQNWEESTVEPSALMTKPQPLSPQATSMARWAARCLRTRSRTRRWPTSNRYYADNYWGRTQFGPESVCTAPSAPFG